MQLKRQLSVVTPPPQESETTRLTVAFATSDLHNVDQHFGSACGFSVYTVTKRSRRLLRVGQFAAGAFDGNESKLAERIEALKSCDAVYCLAIGHSAIQQLLQHSIQPIRVSQGAAVSDLLDELQQNMRGGQVPWVERLLGKQQKPSVDDLAHDLDEEWKEES